MDGFWQESKSRSYNGDWTITTQTNTMMQIIGRRVAEIEISVCVKRSASLLKLVLLQKLKDGGDVKEHLAKFLDVISKLEDMDVMINGDLKAIMLLYNLPRSFENIRWAIESIDKLPSAKVLNVKIMEESDARKQSTGNVVTVLATDNSRNKRNKVSEKSSWNHGSSRETVVSAASLVINQMYVYQSLMSKNTSNQRTVWMIHI